MRVMVAGQSCEGTPDGRHRPSSWSPEENLWVWDVTPDHQLFLDLENPARLPPVPPVPLPPHSYGPPAFHSPRAMRAALP